MKYKTFKLTELKNGVRKIISTGSYMEMKILKDSLSEKLRYGFYIEEMN